MINTFHLGLQEKDIKGATLAILPGDPNRVQKIALLLENPQHLSSIREFTTWSAELNGNTIIICSTGIGGPSTSIAVEELAQIGIRIFLRIGTAGAIQPYIKIGDILIITAAVRCDGASQHFAPLNFPAIADLSCSIALLEASKKIGTRFHSGITVSSDTFYPGQERLNTYSKKIRKKLQGSMQEWKDMGIMSYEMESSTLFTMCATQGLKAGAITGVITNRSIQNNIPENIKKIQSIELIAIKTVIEGAKILLNKK